MEGYRSKKISTGESICFKEIVITKELIFLENVGYKWEDLRKIRVIQKGLLNGSIEFVFKEPRGYTKGFMLWSVGNYPFLLSLINSMYDQPIPIYCDGKKWEYK